MKRPTIVTVFGVIGIVMFAFGLCGFSMSVPMMMVEAGKPAANPAYQPLADSAGLALYFKIALPIALVASVLLLVASIGLLKLKPWARTLTIGYAVYALVAGAIGAIVSFAVYMPALSKMAEQQKDPAMRTGMIVGGYVGGCMGGVIGLAWPVLLLWFAQRPVVREAFGAAPRDPNRPPDLG